MYINNIISSISLKIKIKIQWSDWLRITCISHGHVPVPYPGYPIYPGYPRTLYIKGRIAVQSSEYYPGQDRVPNTAMEAVLPKPVCLRDFVYIIGRSSSVVFRFASPSTMTGSETDLQERMKVI
jgi:hypothetical protein